ncbi:hypothetical protein AMECASPLE_009668, partial [Ameca splendens]
MPECFAHSAGSFLLLSPPEPSRKRTLSTLQRKHLHTELIPVLLQAHTEQYLKNLLQTWILNASSPGDLTTPIYWRIICYVPDYLCHNKHSLHILFSRVFSVCGSWRTDLCKESCALVCASVEHDDSPRTGAVRGVVLESQYLLEPCGTGKTRLTHLSRIDLRGRSPE